MRKIAVVLALVTGMVVVPVAKGDHCPTTRGVFIYSNVTAGVGGGIDFGSLGCPVTSVHLIGPGANSISVGYVYVHDPALNGQPPYGTLTITGLGGSRVIPIPFGISGPGQIPGTTLLRSWPVAISPLAKGSVTAVVYHGGTFMTTYTRPIGL